MTPAMVAANRVRSLKHGRRAVTLTHKEIREGIRAKLAKARSAAVAEAFEHMARASVDGDYTGQELMALQAMAEKHGIRGQVVDKLVEEGVLLREEILGGDGVVLGTRVIANPVLAHLHKLDEGLGYTAKDLLLSRHARGETVANVAVAAALSRDAMLRSADKSRMPPPPPRLPKAIETTAPEGGSE